MIGNTVARVWERLTREGRREEAFLLLNRCFEVLYENYDDCTHMRESVMRMIGDDDGVLLPEMMKAFVSNAEGFKAGAMLIIADRDCTV